MRPGQVRRQVDAGENVRIIQTGAGAVTPGAAGVEALVVAFLLWVIGGAQARGIGCPRLNTDTENPAATEAQIGTVGIA
ncbi:hypothetical protein D3C81_2235800 [compost metagenome]